MTVSNDYHLSISENAVFYIVFVAKSDYRNRRTQGVVDNTEKDFDI